MLIIIDIAVTIMKLLGAAVLFIAVFSGFVSLRELRSEYRIKKKRRENENKQQKRRTAI